MERVAGPNPLRIEEAHDGLQNLTSSPVKQGERVVTDGQHIVLREHVSRGAAYAFADHRQRKDVTGACTFIDDPSKQDVASRFESEAAAVEDAPSGSCASCGQPVNQKSIMLLGSSVWVHATCIRPLFSAIQTPLWMEEHEFDFTRKPLTYPVNENPPVCLRRRPFGGFHSSTYFSGDAPSLDSDQYYVNSSLVGVAPTELDGYIDRLRNPPEPEQGSDLGVRNKKQPWYLPTGSIESVEALPSPATVLNEYGSDTWGNDWFIEMVRETFKARCMVCDEQHEVGPIHILDIDNRCWCHERCSKPLADGLSSAWSKTGVLLSSAFRHVGD